MLNFLSLNDDVLLLIFSNVYGRDALNVALTSKRLYHLASARIAANAMCWNPVSLRRLHHFLLTTSSFGGELRARYMERLIIHTSTFEAELSSTETDPDFDEYYATDFSQANLLGDILLKAELAKEISFDRFQPCLEKDLRIAEGLCSMSRLVNLRLSTIGDIAVSALRLSSAVATLQRLTLSYHEPDDYPLEDTKTLPPLLSLLSAFANVHTVKLWNFTPPLGLLDDSSYTPPSLPSIRYLRLSHSSAPALDMVELCPNLSTLIFSLDAEQDDPPPSVGPKWRPLRRLMIQEHSEGVSMADRLNGVSLLQISSDLNPTRPSSTSPGGDVDRFFDLLRSTSPVGLYLSIAVSGSQPPSRFFWEKICNTAPRLRSLELKFSGFAVDDDLSWLAALSDALRLLPLVCLRVFVPATPRPVRPLLYIGDELMDINDPVDPHAEQQERRRVSILEKLHEPLAEALPNLRYLSIGDAALNEALLAHRDAASHDDHPVYEWDDLRQVECIREQRWWRVKEQDGQRVLERIPEEQGEEAQRVIESTEVDVVADLKSKLSALSL